MAKDEVGPEGREAAARVRRPEGAKGAVAASPPPGGDEGAGGLTVARRRDPNWPTPTSSHGPQGGRALLLAERRASLREFVLDLGEQVAQRRLVDIGDRHLGDLLAGEG